MNRNFTSILALISVCLVFGLLTGCSSSKPPTIAITATSGSGQTQTVNEAFPASLVATVTSNGTAASGVTVTFSAPSTGASCAPSASTATTGSDGTASITCTANGTAGGYSVTATATGATTPASFTETNAAPSVFVFYVSGQEEIADIVEGADTYADQYAIAGAVAFDLSGNVLGGEEDYNDANGITSPGEPATADTIAPTSATPGSSMTVNSTTGTGTLVLVSSNTAVGVKGTETFAVQFINSAHALITQFDGTATSSGSFDLQTATSVSGNYAFTLTGVDLNYGSVGYGGVLADAGGTTAGNLTGTVDENDYSGFSPGNALTATDNGVPSTDAYGRGTITGFEDFVNDDAAVSLAYYVVGPEAVRIIDVDKTDVAVGSAYGQGSSPNFDSTALGTADVLALGGSDPWSYLYAAVGNLVPSGTKAGVAGATFAGEGDYYDAYGDLVTASTTGGNYTVATNGYGSITDITGWEYVETLGFYATDPTLNLLDPNNTSAASVGLVLDQYIPGGSGLIVPQGATTDTDFNTNSYGFGAQAVTGNATANNGWEFDYVGQGTFTNLALTGGAEVSDPFAFFVADTPGEWGTPTTPEVVAGTATGPDAAGRYTYPSATPFSIGPVDTNTNATTFTTVLYEASPAYVFSIDEDETLYGVLWLGTYQEQSSSSADARRVNFVPALKTAKKR